MKRITAAICFLMALLAFSVSAETAYADVVNLPVDTDFFFFVVEMVVIAVIALFIVVKLRRLSEKKRHETPSSPESEGISNF